MNDATAKDRPHEGKPLGTTGRQKNDALMADDQAERVMNLPLAVIDSDPNQPRKLFLDDGIVNLGMSLVQHGQLMPILVRHAGERFVIIDGERRFRAALHAGMSSLRALLDSTDSQPHEDLVKQLVANCQRDGLNPIELADAYARLMQEGGLTATELAAKLARSKGHVSSILSLRKLTAEARGLVASGQIAMGSAAEIARLPADKQNVVALQVASGEVGRGELQRRGGKPGQAADTGLKRVSLHVDGVSVQFSGAGRLALEQIQNLLERLSRECRRARKQGLDVSTFAAVLRDRCRKASAAPNAAHAEACVDG